MSDVKRWLVGEATRVEQLPRLEDALFGFRAARYTFYRLRYVYVQALMRTFFRVAEISLFVSVLPFEVLGPILVLRSIMLVGEGLWWGALETLRRDVRTLFRQGRSSQASQRVRQWLALGFMVATLALAFGGLWVWVGPSPFQSFSVVDAFVWGCCLRWGTDLVVSAYHAGVYGLRRVYRPVWSLVLVDGADIALLLAAFWWFGVWGLGVSLVLVGAVRATVVWAFTRRVYQGLKLDVSGPKSWLRSVTRKAVWSPRHSVEHAASNVVAQVDALFVLGLLSAPGNSESTLILAALFHVLAPLQAAASAWSRLFYFDFKRLEAWGSPFLLQRFEAFLLRASWWVPLPVGVLTLGLMAWLWRGPYLLLALELAVLALVRSRLSLVHMRAYSLGDHRYLRRLFFGMLVIACATPLLAHLPAEQALGTVVTLMTLGLLLLGRSQKPLALRPAGGLVEPSVWLAALLQAKEPVYLGLARVDRRLSSIGRLSRAVREVIGDAMQARVSNDTLLWFSHTPVAARVLLAQGAGTVRELRLGTVAQTGRDALARGLEGDTWENCMGVLLRSEHISCAQGDVTANDLAARDFAVLEQQLHVVHPNAFVVSLDNTSTFEAFRSSGSRALRGLLLDAARGNSHFRTVGEFELAVIAPAGEPRALVVVPKSSRPAQEWKGAIASLVRHTNVVWTLRHARERAGAIVG